MDTTQIELFKCEKFDLFMRQAVGLDGKFGRAERKLRGRLYEDMKAHAASGDCPFCHRCGRAEGRCKSAVALPSEAYRRFFTRGQDSVRDTSPIEPVSTAPIRSKGY